MADEVPLFPLNTVLFPGMPLPLHIFEPRYREMIAVCTRDEQAFGVLLIQEGPEVGPGAVPHKIGTLARIVDVNRFPDGRMNVITVGTQRFRLLNFSADKQSYFVGDVETLEDDPSTASAPPELVEEVGNLVQRYAALVQTATGRDLVPLRLPTSPQELSYLVGGELRIGNRERQRLLELLSTSDRLTQEKQILDREIQTLQAVLEQRQSGSFGPFSRN
jgi:Lon protease-like protein